MTTLIYLFLVLISAVFAFKTKSVNRSGFVAMISISAFFIIPEHATWLVPIMFMFMTSSLLTKVGKQKEIDFRKTIKKSGSRDYIQGLANFGPGLIFYSLFLITPSTNLLVAFLATISAANSDSWASEIGGLDKKKPYSILTFQKIPKGISGGISIIGCLGALLGGLSIAVLSYFIFPDHITIKEIYIITIAGFVGMLLDSLIGAKFQILYKNDKGGLTEQPQKVIEKGFNYINNDMVNFISCFLAGLLVILVN